MSKKKIDALPVTPVKVEGVKAPKPATEYLEEYYKTLGDGSREYLGIRTGFNKLDKWSRGLRGMIILGGEPGKGKTTLALQLAYGACELGTPVVFYSLEMPRELIFTKILNRLAKVEAFNIELRAGQYLDEERQNKNLLGEDINPHSYLSPKEVERLKEAQKKLAELGESFYIRSLEDTEPITFESVKGEINAIKAEHKTDQVFVVIDQLQGFYVEEFRDQIDKEYKLIMGFSEILAKTGATILLLSHKNKAGYGKAGSETIKGSVDIIHQADIVMTLEGDNNKEYDKIEGDDTDVFPEHIDLVIPKARYCRTGKMGLSFDKKYSEFTEV